MADIATTLISKCNPDPTNAGKMLLALNALGMVFAAASNTFAAATDKNTSAEDKKFLVPAGAVTGVANIGLYYTLTTSVINHLQGAKKLNPDGSVKKEIKGLAQKALDTMSEEDIVKNAKVYAQDKIQKAQKGFLGTSIGKKSKEYVQSMQDTFLKGDMPTKEAIEAYKSDFKSGAGVLGAFIGAVVGCAVLTPLIRDVSAYFVQKRMEKTNPELAEKPYRPYFDPSHIGAGKYGKKQPLSMKTYMAFTRGNMKV